MIVSLKRQTLYNKCKRAFSPRLFKLFVLPFVMGTFSFTNSEPKEQSTLFFRTNIFLTICPEWMLSNCKWRGEVLVSGWTSSKSSSKKPGFNAGSLGVWVFLHQNSWPHQLNPKKKNAAHRSCTNSLDQQGRLMMIGRWSHEPYQWFGGTLF